MAVTQLPLRRDFTVFVGATFRQTFHWTSGGEDIDMSDWDAWMPYGTDLTNTIGELSVTGGHITLDETGGIKLYLTDEQTNNLFQDAELFPLVKGVRTLVYQISLQNAAGEVMRFMRGNLFLQYDVGRYSPSPLPTIAKPTVEPSPEPGKARLLFEVDNPNELTMSNFMAFLGEPDSGLPFLVDGTSTYIDVPYKPGITWRVQAYVPLRGLVDFSPYSDPVPMFTMPIISKPVVDLSPEPGKVRLTFTVDDPDSLEITHFIATESSGLTEVMSTDDSLYVDVPDTSGVQWRVSAVVRYYGETTESELSDPV